MKKYITFIKEISDSKIADFICQGHADAGCNGPYGDIDTPLRNTAHWCVTYSFLWEKFHEKKYKEILKVFSDYLQKAQNYGISNAAICRSISSGDDTNGIIGQAWVIEGLIAAYEILNEDVLLEKAISIFLSQKYDHDTKHWVICCSDGHIVKGDFTYNHNLWFAACGTMILKHKEHKEIKENILDFLDNTPKIVGIQPSGKIHHRMRINQGIVAEAKYLLRVLLTDWNIGPLKEWNYLESGYQIFDLYGFALLKEYWGEHNIFKNDWLRKAIKLGTNEQFIWSLANTYSINKYAFPYNAPTFEYPYVAEVLGKGCNKNFFDELFKYQLELTYESDKKLFSKHNPDPNTLTARIYELTRYFNILKPRLV